MEFNSPNPSSVFIAFTFAYLFLPMRYNNLMNYPVIAALAASFAMDACYKVTHFYYYCRYCSWWFSWIFLGSAWYTVFNSSGAGNLLYFDEMESNAVVCKRTSKQTFK